MAPIEALLTAKLKRMVVRTLKLALATFFATSVLAVIAYKFIPVYFTPLMAIRACQQIAHGERLTCHKTWTPINKISKHMVTAVVASEDAKFMKHHGFDWAGISSAAKKNLQSDKKQKVGGSTISQQTAKNVFLWQRQSWLRKGLEAYFTVLIEVFWGKERIMEVYLNVIEMGDGGIYGAQAAAEQHFGRDAATLTRGQAALIAATLPNPHRFSAKSPSAYVWKRQNAILKNMNLVGEVKLHD